MIDYKRLERGLEIWKAGQVSPNGHKGQYYVASQSRNIRYLAASPWAACGARCNCPDARRGNVCKHIWAAAFAEAANRIGRKVEEGMSLERISSELMRMACAGIPEDWLVKWEALWTVVHEMAGEPIA